LNKNSLTRTSTL